MPERLFVFVQMEFPWALGPADGRYLLRAPDGEPEHVVVLGTLGAARTAESGRRTRRRRGGAPPADALPATVATARATVIDPVSLSAEQQARAWLADLDGERETAAAASVVNRVLQAHRIAAADPYVHEISPAQALVVRAGWGEGEQVADGRWLHAVQLIHGAGERGLLRRRPGRSAALRPQERLAALLGGQSRALLCEELALRARLDLEQGRPAHAAVELERAFAIGPAELRGEGRQDLAIRIAELEQLRVGVAAQAQSVLSGDGGADAAPDADVLAHALGRLEAALRARSAAGFARR